MYAIDKAQDCPHISVRKMPNLPATAPNNAKQRTMPQKNASAIINPLLDLLSVLLLTNPAIPSPTGKVQGQTPVDIIPARAAIIKLIKEPPDNEWLNCSINFSKFIV